MAGELWNRVAQLGKEVTPGTAVAATRKVYLIDPSVANARESRQHRFATGSRSNVLAVTQGPDVIGGSAQLVLSADELLEWLLIGIKGGVTPTTPGGATLARLWTFVPSTTLETATLRYNDGVAAYIAAGVQVNQFTFEGSVEGDNMVSLDLFGRSRVAGALTGALSDRTPTFLQGWQTNVYIDALGGTPGTTLVSNAVLNWQVAINNNLDRKFFAGNTQQAGGIVFGDFEVSAQLTFEASAAIAATELANWEANTPRLVRLEFLDVANGIETGFRRFVTIDLPGHWSEPDLAGEDKGTRTYQFNLMQRYDNTNAFDVQIRLQNARTAAW